ncbi:MAG: DUF5661 family protein [Acidimicrobiia bacterium]
MAARPTFTRAEAREIGEAIELDFEVAEFDLSEFVRGLHVELEHGSGDPRTDVTHDDPLVTGKIAWAHLIEFPDYYTRLELMEKVADAEWATRRRAT